VSSDATGSHAQAGPVVWAVVVAAGSGSRFGHLKQFALLAGLPVVERSVTACRSVASGVVLVLPEGRLEHGYGADIVVAGGFSRSDSVRNGLAQVPGDADIVVVHDAARPLAAPVLFASVIAALEYGSVERGPEVEGFVCGAVCSIPVADTLKRVDPSGGTVVGTVDRSDMVAVQTPQAFRADVLRRAHAAGGDATDDAALVEALGATVRVVPGDPRNLKLTTPADLVYAEHLLGG